MNEYEKNYQRILKETGTTKAVLPTENDGIELSEEILDGFSVAGYDFGGQKTYQLPRILAVRRLAQATAQVEDDKIFKAIVEWCDERIIQTHGYKTWELEEGLIKQAMFLYSKKERSIDGDRPPIKVHIVMPPDIWCKLVVTKTRKYGNTKTTGIDWLKLALEGKVLPSRSKALKGYILLIRADAGSVVIDKREIVPNMGVTSECHLKVNESEVPRMVKIKVEMIE